MKITRRENTVDDYHGTQVCDPYRWMEDPDLPETREWVEIQNKLTLEYLEKISDRNKIKERLTELWNYPKYSVPVKRDNRYFFLKNDGLQNQPVLYMQEGDGEAKILLDPNKLSEDGTVALTNQSYTKDGTLLAYGISRSGSDWQEIKIRDIDAGKDHEEVIKWCKFSGIAWKRDNSGFYYNRYPTPGSVPPEDQFNYNSVYWHKLKTPQSEDKIIYERPDAKELSFNPAITDDENYLLLIVTYGCINKNCIYYRELNGNGTFIHLIDVPDAMYYPVDTIDNIFYFHTDLDAPRGRVISIDVNDPQKENWKEIIPQGEDIIDSVAMINNQFVITYLHDAHNKLVLHNSDGTFEREIELPCIGSIDTFNYRISGKREDTEMFFAFTSFLFPMHIYRYDFTTEKLTEFKKSELTFTPDNYETRQVFYPSKDGTKVPMFITAKKGLPMDGNNPAILYGYGGFNISLTPGFSIPMLYWLELGGIYAVANLRGGGEYGEDWHKAGMLDKKQNVFDDFLTAAEWLIENKYTNQKKLAISGGSNGGLLVAACMLQRPDLFGSVICRVPLTDMLRYHKFTVGHRWVPEYGNAETNPEHFRFIYAYSPLHNIKEGAAYPPTLVVTADTDDRVVPGHAKKFVATLQETTDKKNLILLRIETRAGHGQGKPTLKTIDEHTDIFAFLIKIFGIKNR